MFFVVSPGQYKKCDVNVDVDVIEVDLNVDVDVNAAENVAENFVVVDVQSDGQFGI